MKRINVSPTDEMYNAIDQFRQDYKLKSMSEAVLTLAWVGLEEHGRDVRKAMKKWGRPREESAQE